MIHLHTANGHLGDCQFALNALYAMPEEGMLHCNPDYIEALRELVEGTHVQVQDCSRIPSNSLDCWLASGLFEHKGIRYQDDIDILGFVQKYFNAISQEKGMGDIFSKREDMLCRLPSIKNHKSPCAHFDGILVINCDPKSGQCPMYSSSEMDSLIQQLERKGQPVFSVEKAGLSLVEIGSMSINAKLVIGCATGPMWPCLNIWNKDILKIVMLEPMRLNYENDSIEHASCAKDVEKTLEWNGYL